MPRRQFRTISGTAYNMSYEYDLMGNLTSLNYPSSSGTRRKVQYTYTASAELDKVSDITSPLFDYVTSTTYSPLGTVQQMNLQSQVQTILDWNKRGLLTSILTRKDLGGGSYQNHLNLAYTYFADGQVQQIAYNADPNDLKTEKFTYDELLRLATAQRGPDTNIQRKYNYEYDRYGNRWKQDHVLGPSGYDREMGFGFATNRVTDAGFSYDASGNLTSIGAGTSFTYDPESFMAALASSGTTATYKADAEGRRVRKTVNGVATDYFYSGSEVVSEKQDSTWTDYIFFGSQRIAKQTGTTASTATYLHADQLGSTRVCTDSAGNSTGTCDYEPFGEFQPPGASACTVPTNYRYAGMEWDSELGGQGLYHTWFRQYDTTQGRWLGVDPLSGDPDDPQSLNRFAYVANDPVNLADPLGLQCEFPARMAEICWTEWSGASGDRRVRVCWSFCSGGGTGLPREPCDDGRTRAAQGLPPCPTGGGGTQQPEQPQQPPQCTLTVAVSSTLPLANKTKEVISQIFGRADVGIQFVQGQTADLRIITNIPLSGGSYGHNPPGTNLALINNAAIGQTAFQLASSISGALDISAHAVGVVASHEFGHSLLGEGGHPSIMLMADGAIQGNRSFQPSLLNFFTTREAARIQQRCNQLHPPN